MSRPGIQHSGERGSASRVKVWAVADGKARRAANRQKGGDPGVNRPDAELELRRLGLRRLGFQHEEVSVQLASIPGTTQRLLGPGDELPRRRLNHSARPNRTVVRRMGQKSAPILPQTFPEGPRERTSGDASCGIIHTTIMVRSAWSAGRHKGNGRL